MEKAYVGHVSMNFKSATLVAYFSDLRPRVEIYFGRIRRMSIQIGYNTVVRRAQINCHAFNILRSVESRQNI